MVQSQGPGRRLRIYLSASDQWRGGPLYAAIVQEARKQGIAGATVVRGIMGYGAHHAVHEAHLLQLTNNLPVVVEIVDTVAKVQGFLPVLDAMIQEGLVTLSEVELITYGKT
jgi:PII-like signaling protein